MRAYITDFGLATLLDSRSATTLAGSTIMGTPRWLALEQNLSSIQKLNGTILMPLGTDIYAFALVCYEANHTFSTPSARPSLPVDDLSRRFEMEDLIRDCWTQVPTKQPSANKVVERLKLTSQFVQSRNWELIYAAVA